METTLNAIAACGPCRDGWRTLLKGLGKAKADDEPLLLSTILDSNGLDDALWCLRALPAEYDNAVRLMACDLVEPALAYVPEGEDRPRDAVETARRFARGEVSSEALDAAGAAARDAAWDAARAAATAARAAARAAARDAAWDAAGAAARAAARASARAAARAAEGDAARAAAGAAARAAAWDAAWDAARAEQKIIFRAWLANMEEV